MFLIIISTFTQLDFNHYIFGSWNPADPAFLKLKAVLLKVLRHLKPLKLSAAVRFGFDDPASTGYTLGVLSLLYPVFEEHVQLYPDFEQTIFEGWFKVAGRIRASVFLTAACRLILDKNIRRVILALKNI